MKILIVDDNKLNLYILQVLLKARGYEVVSAANGAEALKNARRDPPDMIISDILMPVMDGFTLCREWKGDERLREIPFVFYTATYIDSKDEELALGLGADQFIVKPVEPDEFLKIIKVVIRDMEKGKIKPKKPVLEEEKEVFNLYSQRLVKKLEKKMLELESEITERKHAQEALKESESELKIKNRIADIFLSVPDDKMYAGVLEVVLEAMESRFGFFGYIDEKGALVCPSMTRDIWDQCQVPDKDIVFPRDTWGGIWGRSLMEGKPLYSNEAFRVPEGHVPINSALSVPIILHGEAIGLLTVANKETGYDEKDLGFLKNIADYTAPVLHARLQRDRKEEDKKKLETRLAQAQKMEAIGTLAGGIAHDFNNILGAIIGYAELAVLDVPDGSRVKHDLMKILKAGNRAKDLVQQILTFSRQSEQEKKPVRVGLIVKDALKFLRASLPTSIGIRENIDRDTGIIEADPTQIHQVLMNLGANAHHVMREEGGILEVTLTNVDMDAHTIRQYPDMSSGPYLRLSISDTGHGMTPDVKERIFDPYFTTKEVGEGTGLGLAIVHGIVKDHGGAITVYSEPGKGSTFHVYLPVIEKAEEPQKETLEPLPTGHERILFIDDEPGLVEIGKQMMEKLGYNVVVRTSSIEALELFREQPDRFDLVITDMTMPKMMGDRLAVELMKIRPDIPIILCTGFSERITEEEARGMGIKAFVMKPLVMRVLANTVRRILDG
jgi:signal transduction histidine kinase/DNA-binding response OmpR family regulator